MSGIGIGIGLSNVAAGRGSSLPYTAHADLYAWDFTAPVLNGAKVQSVPEMARGAANAWEQTVAASQPDAVANGASFTADLSRSMALVGGGAVPLNGSNGIYFACNVQVINKANAPRLIKVYDGVNTTQTGRLIVDVLSYAGGQPRSHIDQTDSNAWVWRQDPSGITVTDTVWVTIEEQHDFVTPANNRAWFNGVEVAANIQTPFAATAYPTTDSLGAAIGGSFAGVYNTIAIGQGVLPPAVRQSFSDWANSVRPI